MHDMIMSVHEIMISMNSCEINIYECLCMQMLINLCVFETIE